MGRAAIEQVVVRELTQDEGVAAFDDACGRELGIAGEEFMRAHDSGEYPPQWSAESICRLEMLLPLAR